jgi:hypothetical protein
MHRAHLAMPADQRVGFDDDERLTPPEKERLEDELDALYRRWTSCLDAAREKHRKLRAKKTDLGIQRGERNV